MKILIVNASPRKNGNTSIISDIISERLKSFGEVEIEQVFLSDLYLSMCKGCCNCLITGEEFCPDKEDDRLMLEEKMLSSDGIIFASPVYAMNMTALMKNFMDRFAFAMHRPRFFNQHVMLVAVTGVVGLNETLNSMSQLEFTGFNIVEKMGIVAQNPLFQPSLTDKKLIKKIETKAENFYKAIINKKPLKPSFMTLLAFKAQKNSFFSVKDKSPCDWKYFSERGWFDKKCRYYTDKAQIPIFENFLADLIIKFSNI